MAHQPNRNRAASRTLAAPLREVLADVDRFRLMTNEALLRRRFPNHTPNAVSKITAKLCRSGHLLSFPLFGGRRYFVLAKQSLHLLGAPERRAEPLGSQALPLHYGVLAYCCWAAEPRNRLTPSELLEKYPWMTNADLAAPYCYEKGKLSLIRVDLGGSADHVARKCLEDVRRRTEHPQFRNLIDQDRFRIVIVTALAEKASAIDWALSADSWPITFHTAVITDLLPLLI